jgi:CHAT domain-containing protein
VKPLIGQRCTRQAIEQALRYEQPDIVHLALHGRGDTRRGLRASVMLADGQGGTDWVSFDSLTGFPWTARLVVFSGCSTGVLGFKDGHNLLSVANAALEAGVASVVASLWPVDDEHTRLFMIAFYDALAKARTVGPADLRLVLGDARNSLRQQLETRGTRQPTRRRDGRDFTPEAEEKGDRPELAPEVRDALAWSPFALFGMPILACP